MRTTLATGAFGLLYAAGAFAGVLPLNQWTRHVIDPEKPHRAIYIAAADIDGDGDQDIVTGGWWYENPGQARGNWPRREIGLPLRNMAAVSDFDRDGHVDVLGTQGIGSNADANFLLAVNDGKGTFRIHSTPGEGPGDFLQGIAVAAFDGSHRTQVALSWHRAGQGIQLLTPPANPAVSKWAWKTISAFSQDEDLSAGDIDRDGDLDLLLGTRWLQNDGAAWSLHTLSPVEGDPDRNELADMNGDGRLDAVIGFEAINIPGKLAWYEQPAVATGTWTEHVIGTPVGPMSLSVTDMDGDGDPDVVIGEHNYKEPATAKLIVFENTDGRSSRWRQHVAHTGDEHHDGAVTADIDGDGDKDVISIGWSHGRVVLYENLAVK